MNSKESFMALVPDKSCAGNYGDLSGSEYNKALCTPFKKSDYTFSNHHFYNDPHFSSKTNAAIHEDTNSTVALQTVESQFRTIRSRTLSTIEQTSRRFSEQDEIIEQKDIMISSLRKIIEDQRRKNSSLEEKMLRKDQFHVNSRNHFIEEEYQNQIQRLKYDLHELNSKTNSEMEKLQRKLGEKEYESVKLSISLKEINLNKDSIIEKLKMELESANQNVSSKDSENVQLQKEINFLRQEMGKIEGYLESLPTSEEFVQIKNNMKTVIEEKDQLAKHKESLCINFKETKRELIYKQSQLEKSSKKMSELKNQISMLKSTIEKFDSRGPISIEEHEEQLESLSALQMENEELKQNLVRAQKKLTRFQYEFVAKRKEIEIEKLKFNEEIEVLHQNIKDKSISITKIQTINQELLREKLESQSNLRKLESKYDDNLEELLFTVYCATLSCFDEVKCFVALCTKMSKGEEPDLQLLLGLRDSPEKENKFIEELELEKRLEEIGNVKNELECLRRMVAEKHAEEIGKNMCITQ